MKKALFLFFGLLFASTYNATAQQGVDTLSLKSIFYPPLLAGHRPDFVRFAPHGLRIYYTANDSSLKKNKLYDVNLKGHINQQKAKDNFERNYRLAPNGKKLAYAKNGDIWLADADFSHARKIVSSPRHENDPVWGPDSHQLAFVQNGNVWVMNIDQSELRQVTHKKDKAPAYSIIGWAGSNKLVLIQYNHSGEKIYYFPQYIHKYVEPGKSRRGVARKIISLARLDSSSVKKLYSGPDYLTTSISNDGKYLAVDRRDDVRKHRTIEEYNLINGDSTAVFRDSTKGWFHGTNIAFAPEGHTLMLKSERDGWNHIYTVQPDGSDLTEWNHGKFQVPWAHWLNKHKIVFASTKVGPGQRQVYTVDTRNGHTKKLTSQTGYRENFHLGRNKKYLVYKYSYFNEPWELYSLNLKHPKKETRLTHTIPERFKKMDWQKPDYIRFTARDGTTKVSMTVLKPRHKKPGKKYPVMVFVHGAGTLQNVYKGWSNHYYREYMFNQYLTAHGYYVMQVDYRQSLGYGRKFREAVTGWLGKYETHDIEDGIKYLAAHYPQADTSRTGIYGGSYGGFMSLYATSTAPQYFDAAAALRAVTDWKNYYYYNPWYTRPRLGTPQADSAAYARSSPITYADSLKRPVLLLQGLRDHNVGFKDMAEYVHRLIEDNNKHFQMMMYPTEPHTFKHADDWYDEYRRIFNFMNTHLK